MDPIEVARLDADDGGERWMDALAGWSEDERRAHRRERDRLKPAAGPTPWRFVLVELAVGAAVAEAAVFIEGRSRTAAWGILVPVVGVTVLFQGRLEAADVEAARRRGVELAGDGPAVVWPAWPRTAVSVGAQLAWRKLGRGRQRSGEAAAWFVVRSLATEFEDRWRWRKFPVLPG